MARGLIVLRSGPRHATVRRDVSLPGGDGLLLTIVAVDTAPGSGALPIDAADVQRDLAEAVAGTIAASKGSATARVRGAIDHAQALLRQRRAINPAAEPVAASVGVLLLIRDEVILALTGPWLAYSLEAEGVVSLAPLGQIALGVEEPWTDAVEPPPIGWSQLSLQPGTSVLVAPESTRDGLSDELLERLAALAPEDIGVRLDAAIPREVPALFVARPAAEVGPATAAEDRPAADGQAAAIAPPAAHPPASSSASSTGKPRQGAVGAASGSATAGGVATSGGEPPGATRPPSSGSLDSGAKDSSIDVSGTPAPHAGATQPGHGSLARATLAVRTASAAAALLAARVVRGMLPARSAPDEYREDWARVAAAVAVAVPIGAVLLALAMRSLTAGPVDDALPDPTTDATPDAAAEVEAGASDPTLAAGPGGTTYLEGLRKLADLQGAPGDQRRLVAVDGRPFVLNVETDTVEQVSADAARAVLARGQVVGDETVAELLDLFWLAAPGGGVGGRVAALDAAGRLWSISDGAVQLVERSADPQWGAVSIAAGYDGNFYALDRSAGQIYRYGPDSSGFPSYLEPGMAWLGQAEPLADATDMAIDGAIYVLSGDGSVRKRVAGQPDDAPGLLTPRTSDASALYTSPTAGRLLVADRANGRALALSADGTQIAEMTPPSGVDGTPGRFGALHDLWWDEAGGRLFVVDGDEIHEAPYH